MNGYWKVHLKNGAVLNFNKQGQYKEIDSYENTTFVRIYTNRDDRYILAEIPIENVLYIEAVREITQE